MKNERLIQALLIFAATLVFVLLVAPFDLGVSPDATNYITIARNINQGLGITQNGILVTHWPPLYPIILAIAELLTGLDVMQLGIGVQSLMLIVLAIYYFKSCQLLKINFQLQALWVITLFVSQPMTINYMYWSELPFTMFCTISFYTFIKHLETKNKNLLVQTGVFVGLAVITRYAGLFLLPAYVLILMLQSGKVKTSLSAALRLVLPAILILAVWLFYAKFAPYPHHSAGFPIAWHPVKLKVITDGFLRFGAWFMDNNLWSILLFLFCMGMLIYLFSKAKKTRRKQQSRFENNAFYIALIILAYFATILMSITFLHHSISLNNRYLAPMYPFFLMLLLLVLQYLWNSRVSKNSIRVWSLLVLINMGWAATYDWKTHLQQGHGYNSLEFKPYVQLLPEITPADNKKIYSNAPDFIEFYSEQRAHYIPKTYITETLESNAAFQSQKATLISEINTAEAKLIYFDLVLNRPNYWSRDSILQTFPAEYIHLFQKGFVVGVK